MKIETPFGKIRSALSQEINKAGGLSTREGREMVLLETLSQYMALEAMNNTLVEHASLSLLRTIARTLVHFSAAISANAGSEYSVESTVEELMDALDEVVGVALDEFEGIRSAGGVTTTRMQP